MKNIYLMPTDKTSNLTIRCKTNELMYSYKGFDNMVCYDVILNKNQHLYITYDEKIKKGDWVFDYFKNACPIIRQLTTNEEVIEVQKTELKIILTTDHELIANGVQDIAQNDEEFLKWFVKNPNCEEVEVYKDLFQVNQNNPVLKGSTALAESYKINIPKEKPKNVYKMTLAVNNVTMSCTNKSKQETLEEAAEREYKFEEDSLYSEEDMIEFSEWADTSKESADFWRKNRRSPTMDKSHNVYMREKKAELFQIWKKQFKKK